MNTTKANDICSSVTVKGLCCICGVQPCLRMFWVPAMIFDVTYQVAIPVGDLYIPNMLSDSPIRNHQVSAADVTDQNTKLWRR